MERGGFNREEEEIGVIEGGKGGRIRDKGGRDGFPDFSFCFLFLFLFLGGARRAEQGRATSSSFPFPFFCLLFLFHSFISRPPKGLMMMMIY